jgi:hypothetical protein
MERKTAAITQKVVSPVLPEEVYEALLDPKKRYEFTGSRATGKQLWNFTDQKQQVRSATARPQET